MATKNPSEGAREPTKHESDPHECPFCGEYVASPGKGFMLHVEENPECDADFDAWRDRVADDVPGGWGG
jgi:hypothetical protein